MEAAERSPDPPHREATTSHSHTDPRIFPVLKHGSAARVSSEIPADLSGPLAPKESGKARPFSSTAFMKLAQE